MIEEQSNKNISEEEADQLGSKEFICLNYS